MRGRRLNYVEPLGVIGGMGHYNDALVTAYAEAGYRVSVVTTSASPFLARRARVTRSRAYALARRRTAPSPVRAVAYAVALAGTLRTTRRGDVVVVHFLHAPLLDWGWLHAVRARGASVVMVAHDPIPVAARLRPIGPWYRRALRLAHVVVAHGTEARADLIRLGVEPERIRLAPFGRFRAVDAPTEADALACLGLSGVTRPVVAIVGHMKPGKGIDRVLDSLAVVRGPVGMLLLAGASQGLDDLGDRVASARLAGVRVELVERQLTDEEELAAYGLADVVLAVYSAGYSSGVIARAHAVGRPVVMTRAGDIAEQAEPGDVILQPGFSPQELVGAIREAIRGRSGSVDPSRGLDPRWHAHVAKVTDALRELETAR